MKPTSATQPECSIVISLLKEGYSLHQIESKTGLGRSTIGRIKKETDLDKKNSKGGCPSSVNLNISHGTSYELVRARTRPKKGKKSKSNKYKQLGSFLLKSPNL